MGPVDMRGIEQEFDDVEGMVEKLGPKGAAEAFIKARDFFEKHKGEDAPENMTAKEWSEVLQQNDEGDEEEMMFEGEEEEIFSEDDGADEDDGEPPEKKAKTD